jgi:hypothetical protein
MKKNKYTAIIEIFLQEATCGVIVQKGSESDRPVDRAWVRENIDVESVTEFDYIGDDFEVEEITMTHKGELLTLLPV